MSQRWVFVILRIVSTMQDIVQAVNSLFECAKHENNDMTSTINDLREETYDWKTDSKEDISILQKKVERLNVEFDNINQYEHGDIIPHGIPSKNCKDIVLNLF